MHLWAPLLLLAPVELNPDAPVVPVHAQVVPGIQVDLGTGPHHAGPRTAVQSDKEIGQETGTIISSHTGNRQELTIFGEQVSLMDSITIIF